MAKRDSSANMLKISNEVMDKMTPNCPKSTIDFLEYRSTKIPAMGEMIVLGMIEKIKLAAKLNAEPVIAKIYILIPKVYTLAPSEEIILLTRNV